MGEVKFRVWCKEGPSMLDWEYLISEPDFEDFMKSANKEDERYSKMMQYAGLNDGNDTKIYEADIVKNIGPHSFDIKPYGLPRKFSINELFVVEKSPAGFILRHVSDYRLQMKSIQPFHSPGGFYMGWKPVDNYQFWNLQRSLEVVGNIYENPEMLELPE